MDINGIPLHPLVVHAVVVLTPLAGLLAVGYAVVPRWRWALRWPLVAAAVSGAIATYVASASGRDLRHRLGLRSALMDSHAQWAGRLQTGMFVLVAVVLLAAYVMPFASPLRSGATRDARIGVLSVPLAIVLPVLGVAILFLVFKTGEAGAQLVWSGTPK